MLIGSGPKRFRRVCFKHRTQWSFLPSPNSQNSPSLPQNSLRSLFRNSTLETVFWPFPSKGKAGTCLSLLLPGVTAQLSQFGQMGHHCSLFHYPFIRHRPPGPTLESASPSPPQGSIWHRNKGKSGNGCRIDAKSTPWEGEGEADSRVRSGGACA